jgi:hypothetical protein
MVVRLMFGPVKEEIILLIMKMLNISISVISEKVNTVVI